jgi:hypothetical protein
MGWLFSQKKLASYAQANPTARLSVRARASFTLDYSVDCNDYEFVSGNPLIARVDGNGVVTALRAGMTVISLKTTDGSELVSSVLLNVTP